MELSEVPIWQWILAGWSSMWILSVGRTWSRIVWLLERTQPRHLMLRQPFLHFLVYSISINIFLPIIGLGLILSDDKRDLWVKAYVKSLGSDKK
ncbi:MAG TPA: hypothetical protein DCM10_00055 [Xanthomarina gelatinilytica]|nr:hypothetical protein [Xanthomarina gelatinilytica]|tara:strand:+ start:2278 stop:2559 length:282 start_codon:yes stop_codon:yes gene_type:complete